MADKPVFRPISDYIWEAEPVGDMRVPARVFASKKLWDLIQRDNSLKQLCNVATLPGIVGYALAMPDIHEGYGFPIGGVAAFRVEDGIISPGGVGYDVNCLYGDAKVLHIHGYTRAIADMEADWPQGRVRCQDFRGGHGTDTPVIGFLRRRPYGTVYRVTTDTGHETVATADHPFWTPAGMVELRRLQVGDRVAVYPFEGVPYEEPAARVLVDESHIVAVLERYGKAGRGRAVTQVLRRLRSRGLLPLRANAPQVPYLLKLLGYVLGDGTVYFTGGTGKGVVWFYGRPEDLEAIRADVAALGFTPSRIYSRPRRHRVTTAYRDYEFESQEHAVKVVSSSFAALLVALGAPVGNKAVQDYGVPEWLLEAPRWHQRLFLAALFGAELSAPRALDRHNHNFMTPVLSVSKRESHVDSGRRFLEDIGRMLAGFGVQVLKISQRREQTHADGSRSVRLRLVLSARLDSLRNLWGRIGFEYNQKRQALASVAVGYLRYKAHVLRLREEAASAAVALRAQALPPTAIFDRLVGLYVNRRFLERSLYEGRTSPRVGAAFMTFEEYRRWATEGLGTSGMVWSRIIRLEPIPFAGDVYDLTVAHPDHNFIADGFVVSNCGVRVVVTNLTREDLEGKVERLADVLFETVPTGVGAHGAIRKLSREELRQVVVRGARWAVEEGFGTEADLAHTEENGCLAGADPDKISHRAYERGADQLGTLGSGNHFAEVDVIDEIYDEAAAQRLGLFRGQVVYQIHCGSRGFGHQICDDYLGVMYRAVQKYGIRLPDRQLVCAPLSSPEAQDYLGAMRGAANFAWCNRQIIMALMAKAFQKALGVSPRDLGVRLLYDVCHNIAKIEEHVIDGQRVKVCVHRKGATRAFPPGRPEIPADYRDIGQPVLIPGDMGRYSYILLGKPKAMELTFGSSCHGAGRVMSRAQAKRLAAHRDIERELREMGIIVRGESRATIDEEMSEAYKDVSEVVEVVHRTGISTKFVRLRPVCVIKG
ncbi:RNA-splicing ligase RtcB [bacterium HR11]|nr:RNA-splicing ligase RtcB [bacterium HR11]